MEKELKAITKLLQQLVVIQLYRSGVSQGEVGKRVRLAKASVNQILKEVKRDHSK
ncbi:MAG: hypothetical protein Q7R48_02840 [bacterium]|nr:hypothetical protein [bacterium]